MIGAPVIIRYRRLPGDERIFRQRLIAELPGCVVTLLEEAPVERPVKAGGRTVLEPGAPVVWFTYPGLWYDIGRFHLADGTFTGLYANILTPVRMEGLAWETTDLFLDVWVSSDGEVEILDEDEFGEAVAAGLLDEDTAGRARSTAASLVEGVRLGSWPPEHVHLWTLDAARERLKSDGTAPR